MVILAKPEAADSSTFDRDDWPIDRLPFACGRELSLEDVGKRCWYGEDVSDSRVEDRVLWSNVGLR